VDVINHVETYVNEMPTIEPEVRHGRWIFVGEETMHDGWTYRKHKCSECGFSTVEAINFCQKCGARMDAEDINVFTKDGMTNGDRIRLMTDEELSVFLGGIADNCSYNTCDNCPMYGACVDVPLSRYKWLRKEAEEDAAD
jgi:ribosomal protein L37AE/L43A